MCGRSLTFRRVISFPGLCPTLRSTQLRFFNLGRSPRIREQFWKVIDLPPIGRRSRGSAYHCPLPTAHCSLPTAHHHVKLVAMLKDLLATLFRHTPRSVRL